MGKEDFLEELISCGERGKINRRAFFKLAAAAGVIGLSAKVLAQASPIEGEGGKSCLQCHSTAPADYSPQAITKQLIDHAHALGIDLVWDRGALCDFSMKDKEVYLDFVALDAKWVRVL